MTRGRTNVAANGREAIECLGRERPDVVILDMMMPALSGNEVLAFMGRTAPLATVPIIVVSASPAAQVDRRAARVVAIMRKPVSLHALVQKVQGISKDP